MKRFIISMLVLLSVCVGSWAQTQMLVDSVYNDGVVYFFPETMNDGAAYFPKCHSTITIPDRLSGYIEVGKDTMRNEDGSIMSDSIYGVYVMPRDSAYDNALSSFIIENCSELTHLIIDGSSVWGGSVSGCDNLTTVTLGENFELSCNFDDLFSYFYGWDATYTNPTIQSAKWTTLDVDKENGDYYSLNNVVYAKRYFEKIKKNTMLLCVPGLAGSYTIPRFVTAIGRGAFYKQSKLTDIFIPDSVTSIGSGAFSDCSGLTAINVDKSNARYSSLDGVLYNKAMDTLIYCPRGKTGVVDVPNTVKVIGRSAFNGCSELTSVTIGNSVASIGESAFYNCSKLTSITIPNSVTSIGESPFSGCVGLTVLNVDKNNAKYSSLDGVLYNKVMDTLIYCPMGKTGVVDVPNTVKVIGGSAFAGCIRLVEVYNLSKLTITAGSTDNGRVAYFAKKVHTSATEKSILVQQGDYTFAYVDGKGYLLSYAGKDSVITLPSSFTYEGNTISNYAINNNAFRSCSKLTSVTIGNSVTSIEENAFYNCSELTSIKCFGEPAKCVGDFYTKVYNNATLYVLPNTYEKYKTADIWKKFKNIEIMDSVTVTTSDSSAVITWRKDSSATSYTMTISKNGIPVCDLIFDKDGKQTSINIRSASDSAAIFSYTITGLEPNTDYNFEMKALDASNNVLETKTGLFHTLGSATPTSVNSASIANAKVYTQGKEIIVAFGSNEAVGVQIYDLGGKLVYSSASGDVDFDAPQSGVYVVKIGSEAKKVMVK